MAVGKDKILQNVRETLPRPKAYTRLEKAMMVIGGTTGVGGLAAAAAGASGGPTVAVGALGVMGVTLLAALTRDTRRRADGYAAAIPHIFYATRLTQMALTDPEGTEQGLKRAVVEVLSSAAQAFSLVLNTDVSATIKEIVREPGPASVKTAVEDNIARVCRRNTVNQRQGGTRRGDDQLSIEDFASLKALMSRTNGLYYLSNDCYLDFVKHQTYFHPQLIDPSTGLFKSVTRKTWPLPFRATLVVPIRADLDEAYDRWPGFLCLDSRKKSRFDTMSAPSVAAVYADLLYLLYQHGKTLASAGGRHSVGALLPGPDGSEAP